MYELYCELFMKQMLTFVTSAQGQYKEILNKEERIPFINLTRSQDDFLRTWRTIK